MLKSNPSVTAKSAQPDIIATKTASQYGTSEPQFLFYPFLPYKKLIVVQGESGIGKSTFLLNLASRLSKGEHMPFALNNRPADRGNILYFNSEDDIEETINPRLIAMGADLERFILPDEPFYLDNDCKRFENTIREFDIRLVIIDPLTAVLSPKHNMNIAQSVGNLMRGLSRVAFTTNSAIVIVCHMSKSSSGKEIDRHLGSSDIINAARSVISATRENDNSEIITVKHLKSTLAKRANPFYYEIIGNGIIEFISGVETLGDTDEVFSSKKELAQEKILELLSDGARQSSEIMKILKSAGISESTINAAKREAFIESKKIGDNWLWLPPGQGANPIVD
jgi:RecA-family ATPase